MTKDKLITWIGVAVFIALGITQGHLIGTLLEKLTAP